MSQFFFQVMLGIIGAALVLGTIAGIVNHLKYEAEKEEIKIVMNEIKETFGNKSNNTKTYPLYTTPRIIIPKSIAQIRQENSIKAYEAAKNEVAEFKAQYKKPEECHNMQDKKTRIFCANHFIKSRKEWNLAHGIEEKG